MNRKFPISLQHDAMLCGIACLQMVCDFYGKNYTSKHLSKLCSVTTEGVSLFSIDETAKILGFHTLCARIETNILLKVCARESRCDPFANLKVTPLQVTFAKV